MKIVQIPVGGFDNNFTYLLIDSENNAILIDPTGNVNFIEEEISRNKANVKLILITHNHPDHIENLKKYSKGKRVIIPKKGNPGEMKKIKFYNFEITQIHTPGHSEDSACYLFENNIFTGDTIFCKGIGTTAFGGDKKEQEETLKYLFSLDSNLILWPGHNYGGNTCRLIEALANANLKPSEEEMQRILVKKKKYKSQN